MNDLSLTQRASGFAASVPLTLSLCLLAVAALLLPSLTGALEFSRASLADGECWRLLTGHLTHWNFDHFMWDLVMFAALGAICERRGRGRYAACLLAAALAIPLCVYALMPEMATYRGLSGLDSALFAMLAVLMLREKWAERDWTGTTIVAILLLGFAAKVGYEFVTLQTVFVDSAAADFIPLPLAHIVGAAVGTLAAVATMPRIWYSGEPRALARRLVSRLDDTSAANKPLDAKRSNMIRTSHACLICLGIAFQTLLIPGCLRSNSAQTVDGPEAENLIGKLSGNIVTNDSGDITVISLPSLAKHTVRKFPKSDDGIFPTIHALSGPDREGRIAYIEDYFFVKTEREERHLLKTVDLDGKNDHVVFSRPGSAMWATSAAGNGEIGSHVSLAPTGGLVAFISKVTDKQMPRVLLHVGHIEIWNIDEKTGYDTKVTALDEPISWFPNGERFAYARLVAREHLPKSAEGLEHFGNYFGEAWDEIPAIYVYDVDMRKSTFFYVGWRPVVSSNGKTVLIGGWDHDDYRWRRVNADTGESSSLILPGFAGDIIGTDDSGLVLYLGLPTTGSPIKYTKNNSPLRGPKQMLTVKVVDRQGTVFQTVIPSIDPRSNASYGPAADHR